MAVVLPRALAVADFNGDGNLDLAVANQTSNDVSILMGQGDGTSRHSRSSRPASSRTRWRQPISTGTGALDLIVGNLNSPMLTMLLGRGDGTFAPPLSCPTQVGVQSLVTGDFTGDGIPDVVVVNSLTNELSVFLGRGDGTLQAGIELPTGHDPYHIIAVNLNKLMGGWISPAPITATARSASSWARATARSSPSRPCRPAMASKA